LELALEAAQRFGRRKPTTQPFTQKATSAIERLNEVARDYELHASIEDLEFEALRQS
jgi:hypothetical protein